MLVLFVTFCKRKSENNDQNLMLMLNYVGIYLAVGCAIGETRTWGSRRLAVFFLHLGNVTQCFTYINISSLPDSFSDIFHN